MFLWGEQAPGTDAGDEWSSPYCDPWSVESESGELELRRRARQDAGESSATYSLFDHDRRRWELTLPCEFQVAYVDDDGWVVGCYSTEAGLQQTGPRSEVVCVLVDPAGRTLFHGVIADRKRFFGCPESVLLPIAEWAILLGDHSAAMVSLGGGHWRRIDIRTGRVEPLRVDALAGSGLFETVQVAAVRGTPCLVIHTVEAESGVGGIPALWQGFLVVSSSGELLWRLAPAPRQDYPYEVEGVFSALHAVRWLLARGIPQRVRTPRFSEFTLFTGSGTRTYAIRRATPGGEWAVFSVGEDPSGADPDRR